MAEILVAFCDYCNPQMSTNPLRGRGFTVHSEEEAIADFDWIRTSEDKIMCLECQDEKESEDK